MYNNFTREKLEEVINDLIISNKKEDRRITHLYMSEEAGKMFHQAVLDTVKSWQDNLNITFKTKSGKEIKIPYSEYNKLKQETKDKLEPYKINGNI